MSIRGGVGRFYERMSNQIWDSEHQNLPGYGSTSVTHLPARAAALRPGHLARRCPTTTRTPRASPPASTSTAACSTARRPCVTVGRRHRRPCTSTTGSSACSGASAATWWWRRTTSAPAGGNMYYRWDINRFNGDLLDGRLDRILPGFSADQLRAGDRREPLQRRWPSRLKVQSQRPQLRRRLHAGQGHRPVQLGHGRPPRSVRTPTARTTRTRDRPTSTSRHKVAVSLNWKLPSPARGAAKAILGGWQLAGVMHRAERHARSRCSAAAASCPSATPRAPSSATAGATTTRTAPTTTGRTCRPSATRRAAPTTTSSTGSSRRPTSRCPALGQRGHARPQHVHRPALLQRGPRAGQELLGEPRGAPAPARVVQRVRHRELPQPGQRPVEPARSAGRRACCRAGSSRSRAASQF